MDTAGPNGPPSPEPPEPPEPTEATPSTELVARDDDQDVRRQIEQPAKLMRIATTVQTLFQGVFHGIQASVATQQMAAQQQLAQMQHQAKNVPGPRSGQYL
jgi:hypothetical protein